MKSKIGHCGADGHRLGHRGADGRSLGHSGAVGLVLYCVVIIVGLYFGCKGLLTQGIRVLAEYSTGIAARTLLL